ncbi:flavin-binding monooxygenase-like domain-containing protein [Trichoderma breve]|uniref:Flavin-binding monooxygenase-like domain-containing protein n=1 Tax=Trichoderma breve TaxID=2034170 RepID=A0A9W9E9L8_9HYPO|nr:flavin-binding monooxygenase-like domain-containing protein [Trichoderma breve]KAJ4862012.1 flavin-binding monooxygenase-like domain-containing protein [Trichoderma breve]
MRVAIIGGGPSGIVQLKVLTEAHRRFSIPHLELRLFESHNRLGGIFSHHSYEDAELVSSKYLTAFSDFRPRRDDPDFFSADRYLEYLDEYATHFELWPYINLNAWVKSIRRGDSSEHVIIYRTATGEEIEWECDAIAICSGVHAIPNIPNLSGIEHVPVVMHSADFKSRKQFGKGKTVMVIGSGETGADICYLAVTGDTDRVILCHRDGWLGAPKRVPGQKFLPWLFGSEPYDYPQLPLDVSQVTLFDSMYVHPIVRDSMIVWNFYHFVGISAGGWLCGDSIYGIDQFVGQIYSERFHASRVFFNKAWQRICNHVSAPWRPTKWPFASRIRRFFFNTDIPSVSRIIEVAPNPSHISEDGVAHFPLNGRPESERINETVVKPDVVIFATGYLPAFPYLNTPENAGRKPYPVAFDADVRQIWNSDDPTIGFIGFVRPGFGAIPPLAEMQAMLFTTNLINRIPRPLSPEDEWHYRIIHTPDARVSYGVEHDSYAYQLAKDIDGAPTFWEVLKMAFSTKNGWRLPYIWAAGASFNTKFRMRGPWKWEGAGEVMTGELWETISRREGLFGNVPLSVIPMVYLGSINLFYLFYAGFWNSLAKLRLVRPIAIQNEPKRIMQEMERACNSKKGSKLHAERHQSARSEVM